MFLRVVAVSALSLSWTSGRAAAGAPAPASPDAQVRAWTQELAFNDARAREAADRLAAFASAPSSGFVRDASAHRKLAAAFKAWLQQHAQDGAYAAWALVGQRDSSASAKLAAAMSRRGWAGDAAGAGAPGALAAGGNLEQWTEGFLRDLCQEARTLASVKQGSSAMWNSLMDWWQSLPKN